MEKTGKKAGKIGTVSRHKKAETDLCELRRLYGHVPQTGQRKADPPAGAVDRFEKESSNKQSPAEEQQQSAAAADPLVSCGKYAEPPGKPYGDPEQLLLEKADTAGGEAGRIKHGQPEREQHYGDYDQSESADRTVRQLLLSSGKGGKSF